MCLKSHKLTETGRTLSVEAIARDEILDPILRAYARTYWMVITDPGGGPVPTVGRYRAGELTN